MFTEPEFEEFISRHLPASVDLTPEAHNEVTERFGGSALHRDSETGAVSDAYVFGNGHLVTIQRVEAADWQARLANAAGDTLAIIPEPQP
jgi:hypothetical protein